MQVISNAVGLFAEMVGSLKDEEPMAVRDPVMAELADHSAFYKRCAFAVSVVIIMTQFIHEHLQVHNIVSYVI